MRPEARTTRYGLPTRNEARGTTDEERGAHDAVNHERLAELRALGDGDPEYLAEILGEFVQDAIRLTEAIRKALTQGDAAALAEAAHCLKGSSGNIGALALAGICDKLQSTGEGGDLVTAGPLVARLAEESVRVQERLRRELST